jgi:tetratricopeptide (TPR) repeat protein
MSGVHIYLGASGKKPVQEEFSRAKEYAQKAIQLDDRAAESHEALANIYIFHDWNWDESFRLLNRAIELNPSYAGAYLTKAILLAIHENYHEAIETAKKSIQLDPFNPPGIFAYASILLFADRLQECSAQLDKLFNINPDFTDALFVKGLVYQLKGEYKKAMDLFVEIQKLPGYEMMGAGYLGALYKSMTMVDKSKAILEKLLESEKSAPDIKAPFAIAHIYAALDKPDEMFHYLNESVERKDHSVVYILGYPSFRKYRSDPRFTMLIKKIGLWK